MGGNLVPKVRPHREGVRIPAVESALADAAEKLSHLPPPKRMYQRRKMAPKPPPPDPLVTPGTSVEAPPSEKSSGPTKPISKKPKKGQATTKQRLGRILKIHKMVYLK
ncbi:PREDICTED: lysine-specific demethylase phf2-like [Priapulus caudatus]|uniref:Lysine-specific demethylase phf2-like n=1 Tax=Priapulus caudatus TaxID=37621 RepID=A0ABM1EM82_PRICU|nr:PREDICTED: lysine-specific demethylase phf2-like [Priapulus caudatus]